MAFPIETVREKFPALARPIAYLDNPAGTQIPEMVIDAVAGAMRNAASNLGGFFPDSREASEVHGAAHEAAADFLGGRPSEIVIGQSMTMLTFQCSRSLGRLWQAGDEVIVTRMDHEGNVSPWLRLAEERGLVIRWLPFNRDTWRIECEELKPLLNERTRLLAINCASNLTGSINDVAALTQLAKAAGALVYADAVQLAPHRLIDVEALGCDFLVCSAYKFFGPHVGVLWGREDILADLYPYAVRCAPQGLPGRHETGTPQTELLAGLAAAVDYMSWLGRAAAPGTGNRRALLAYGFAAAAAHESQLMRRSIEGLQHMKGVRIHGITNLNQLHERVPTISLTQETHSPKLLAQGLSALGINVWSGHNYALEVVRQLGLDENEGVLRIGYAHYNTLAEVDRLLDAFATILCQ